MRVTKLIVKEAFPAFKSTIGGSNVAFGKPGSMKDVKATYRPDLYAIALERDGFDPHLLPLDNVLDFEVDSIPPAPTRPAQQDTPDEVRAAYEAWQPSPEAPVAAPAPPATEPCVRTRGCPKPAGHKGFCPGPKA